MNSGSEVKSNLFGCTACGGEKNLCLNPTPYSEIRVGEIQDNNNNYITNQNPDLNYFNTPDMRITPDEFVAVIEIAKGLGINMPKVAVLSATELVNPALQSALDAYELVLMNEKAAIRGYIVDVLYV